MKILINALSARLGGGQTYLINLLANLPINSDLEILIYAPKSLSLPHDSRIKFLHTVWPTENPLFRTIWEKLALPVILYKEKIQILFCPGGVITSTVPSGCKTVTMFRNMIPFDRKASSRIPVGYQKFRNIILKRVMLRSMASADLTIFISEHARQLIESLIRIPNAVSIPHGINDSFRTHTKTLERSSWLPDGEYLLYVSRFDLYKHQLEVTKAYSELSDRLRRRYKLLLVGEVDVDLVSQVTALAIKNGIEEQILIAGPIAYHELPNAYHHAALTLFASSCENCPNILLEALGSGRPVLSSNVMPMPEFGAESVEYFDPFDSSSIRDALNRVLNNDDRMIALAALAGSRSRDFDWKITSAKTWKQIIELIET